MRDPKHGSQLELKYFYITPAFSFNRTPTSAFLSISVLAPGRISFYLSTCKGIGSGSRPGFVHAAFALCSLLKVYPFLHVRISSPPATPSLVVKSFCTVVCAFSASPISDRRAGIEFS